MITQLANAKLKEQKVANNCGLLRTNISLITIRHWLTPLCCDGWLPVNFCRLEHMHVLNQLIYYSKNCLESQHFHFFFSIPVFHQPDKSVQQRESKLQKHTLLQRIKIMLHDQVICTVTHVLTPRQTRWKQSGLGPPQYFIYLAQSKAEWRAKLADFTSTWIKINFALAVSQS